jgi:hypothetical protein
VHRVSAELMATKQGKGFKFPNPPVFKIITSNKERSIAIDTIAKTKIKGQYLRAIKILIVSKGEDLPPVLGRPLTIFIHQAGSR